MTGLEVKVFDLAALQLDTAGSLRQDTGAAHSEHWGSAWLHVADFQLGFGNAEFNGATGFTLAVVDIARTVGVNGVATAHVAGTASAVTTVQLDCQVTVRINADTDQALGVTGAVVSPDALGPVFLVTATVFVITVEVVVANQQVQRAVFNKTFGFSLVTYERGGRSQLGTGCCCNCQCDHAPLHHAHRDLLLWF
ncbi:hypothetical protein D3C75_580500 [compost metagenome]